MEKAAINFRLQQIWVLTKKNIELYYKRGPVVIFGFLFPFFMSLTWILGSTIDPNQFYSGILGMSIFFISSAISPAIFPWETREKNLEWIVSTPISLIDLLASINIASLFFGLSMSTILALILMIFLKIPVWTFLWFFLGGILLSWISSCIGVLISAIPTDMTSNIMTVSTMVRFPLVFISGIFISLNKLTGPFFLLALFSPITYFVDLMRSVLGVGSLNIGLDIIVLVSWAIGIYIIAYIAHSKTLLKRL